MANWSVLKAAIANAIKTNGNQEITGQVLQNALNNIVSTVGENATFAGIATPTTNPGTPDGPIFYFATEAGTYSNFGGVTIKKGRSILYNFMGSWQMFKAYSIDEDIKGIIKLKANDFILKGVYVRNMPIGSKFNFNNFIANSGFNCAFIPVAANTEIELINIPGNSSAYGNIIILDAHDINSVINKIVLTDWLNTFIYTADTDVVLLVNTQAALNGSEIVIKNNIPNTNLIAFILSKEINTIKDNIANIVKNNSAKTIKPNDFIIKNKFLKSSGSSIGDFFTFSLLVDNSGFNCTVLYINKGDIIKFNNIPMSGSYNAIYVIDPSSKVIIDKIVKEGLNTFEYTAEDDVIIAVNAIKQNSQTDISTSNNSGFREGVALNLLKNNSCEDILLPTFIDCPIGKETSVFLANVNTNYTNSKPLVVKSNINSSKCKVLYYNGMKIIKFLPTLNASENLEFTIFSDSDMKTINAYRLTTFRCVPTNVGNGTIQKNILIIGDSLTDSGYGVAEMLRLLKQDNDFIFNLIGTESDEHDGEIIKHEGKNGWSYNSFVNLNTFNGFNNPFRYNGELNFQHYMNTYFSGQELNYVVICLGTNDVTHGYNLMQSQDSIDGIINKAKIFVDAILSSNNGFPNCKIAIGLPAPGNPYFDNAYSSSEIFLRNIQRLDKALLEVFDNGKYHANVTCLAHGAYLDRYGCFGKTSEDVSEYSTNNLKGYVGTNNLHPSIDGYKSFGRAYYGKIRAFLNGLL